jgi:hypothetical protein
MYKVSVPMHSKYDLSRTMHDVLVQLPHEELSKEVALNPSAATGPLDPEWTDAYRVHPVVVAHPESKVIPLAFYLDGISFTKSDTLLGIFVYSLHSMSRHLVAVLRKSHFCRCGCKGWCTLFPMFAAIKWSFDVLASGVFKRDNFDGHTHMSPI